MESQGSHGEPDLLRFGKMVRARRAVLGLTQEEVSALGGPSDTTFTKIENLEWRPGRAATLKKLDAGLKWEPGSSARILYEGGDPSSDRPPARNNADLAVEVAVRLDEGIAGLRDALRELTDVPPDAERAMEHLDAASYLAEALALQLAGPALAQRRREARARTLELSSEPTVGPLVTSHGSVLARSTDAEHRERAGWAAQHKPVREP